MFQDLFCKVGVKVMNLLYITLCNILGNAMLFPNMEFSIFLIYLSIVNTYF